MYIYHTSTKIYDGVHFCMHRSISAVLLINYMDSEVCATSTGEFLQEHRHVLETRLQPIVREIADARARSRDELEGK